MSDIEILRQPGKSLAAPGKARSEDKLTRPTVLGWMDPSAGNEESLPGEGASLRASARAWESSDREMKASPVKIDRCPC